MDRIIVMADIHITSEGDDIIGINPMTRFQNVMGVAVRDHPDTSMIIVMGDLAHHGTCDQYQRLLAVIAACPVPVVPMLDNHDIRENFERFSPKRRVMRRGLGSRLLILSITVLSHWMPTTGRSGIMRGSLCTQRMAQLQAALKGAGTVCRWYLCTIRRLRRAVQAWSALTMKTGRRAVRAWTMFKSPCHQGVMGFDDPNSSLSVDEHGAYGVLRLSHDEVAAHSQDVDFDQEIQRDTESVTD